VSLVHRFEPGAPGAPTLLALHGRGGAEGDLQGLGDALGGGVGVLAPRGPEPQGGGFAWFRHHAIGVPEIASLDESLALVGAWLDAAVAEHGLEAPLTAVGFSNGGMMAGALSAARPDLVGDVALLSSAYPLPEGTVALGGLAGRRVLAAGGLDDPFLPRETAVAGVASYRAAGAEVTEAWRPGGHWIGPDEVAALAGWLRAGPG
jgi:phospholipase/carboxylesterase